MTLISPFFFRMNKTVATFVGLSRFPGNFAFSSLTISATTNTPSFAKAASLIVLLVISGRVAKGGGCGLAPGAAVSTIVDSLMALLAFLALRCFGFFSPTPSGAAFADGYQDRSPYLPFGSL